MQGGRALILQQDKLLHGCRISLLISTKDESVLSSVEKFKDYILNETLTTEFEINDVKGVNKILDYAVDIKIKQT